MIKFNTVSNPRFANADETMINVDIDFDHIGDPGETVSFTASPDDCEPHGKEIYAKAANGDYGPIAPYVAPPAPPPSPLKKAQDDIEKLKAALAAANIPIP